MTPRECGQVARGLSDNTRAFLKAWALDDTAKMVGCILDNRPGIRYRTGDVAISNRERLTLKRKGLAEEHLLWLALEKRGVAVARWLAGVSEPEES